MWHETRVPASLKLTSLRRHLELNELYTIFIFKLIILIFFARSIIYSLKNHGSYLALVAGIVSEADYVFIPESPPPSDWPTRICNKLTQASEMCTKKKFADYLFIKLIMLV